MRCRLLIALFAVFLLSSGGGCTVTSFDGPPQGPAPNYRAIIAQGLIAKTEPYAMGGASYFVDGSGLFLPDKRLNNIEISDKIRIVQSITNGWVWQTCMRLHVNDQPRIFAVYIADGHAVNAREPNLTDNCDGNYAPLEVREYHQVKRDARRIGK